MQVRQVRLRSLLARQRPCRSKLTTRFLCELTSKTDHVTDPAAHESPDPKVAGTPWAWLLALAPVVSALALQPALIGFQQAAASSADGRASQQSVNLVMLGFTLNLGVTFLLIGVSGLLAFLDQRGLRQRGIDRPFPWGWGFLYGVYLIGRTIVLRRRTGRGAAPLVLAAALLVAAMLGLFIQFGIIFATALQHAAIHG